MKETGSFTACEDIYLQFTTTFRQSPSLNRHKGCFAGNNVTDAGTWANTTSAEVKNVCNYTYYCSTQLHGMVLNEQSARITLLSFFLQNKYNNFSDAENYETLWLFKTQEKLNTQALGNSKTRKDRRLNTQVHYSVRLTYLRLYTDDTYLKSFLLKGWGLLIINNWYQSPPL